MSSGFLMICDDWRDAKAVELPTEFTDVALCDAVSIYRQPQEVRRGFSRNHANEASTVYSNAVFGLRLAIDDGNESDLAIATAGCEWMERYIWAAMRTTHGIHASVGRVFLTPAGDSQAEGYLGVFLVDREGAVLLREDDEAFLPVAFRIPIH